MTKKILEKILVAGTRLEIVSDRSRMLHQVGNLLLARGDDHVHPTPISPSSSPSSRERNLLDSLANPGSASPIPLPFIQEPLVAEFAIIAEATRAETNYTDQFHHRLVESLEVILATSELNERQKLATFDALTVSFAKMKDRIWNDGYGRGVEESVTAVKGCRTQNNDGSSGAPQT